MRISIKYLMTMGLCVTILAGCKKGSSQPDPVIPDTTKPTITIVKPTAGQSFTPGSSIAFQASFSDNEKLGSYAITISRVFTGGFILKNVPVPVDWSYSKATTNFNSGVKQQEIILNDISIPKDLGGSPITTGKYYLKVTCTDAAANSYSVTVEIAIN
jgi:hypothetical protein